MTRPRTGSLPRAMHNCRRPTLIGAGCFSAAAAPANRTRCRQRCILRCALASSAFTSSPQPRPTFTMSTSKARAVYSRPAAVIRGRVGCRRGDGWNGRTAQCVCFFSGEEPESLRGPQCELCIIDEIGRMRYQQSVFDTMMLGLRLGDRPRVLLATTPRTTPFMKRLVAMDDVRITTGSTYDNAVHLSANFLKKVRELYEGTRLGRQELQGAMILDPQNALFKDDWLIHDEVAEDLIEQVTVGVDPSGGEDEVGIVASALLNDGRFAVLADRTTTGSPAQWGEAVVRCHDDYDADDVVVEVNFGGDMA